MKPEIKNALDVVMEHYRNMSNDELLARLEAGGCGVIATAVRELIQFAEYLEENPIREQPKVSITKDMVLALREASGMGMMSCKKALRQANGDFDEAKEILRSGYHGHYC
jgi:hypothetical protein